MGARNRFPTHTPFLLATFILLSTHAFAGGADQKSSRIVLAQVDGRNRGPGVIGPNWRTVRAVVEKREDDIGILSFKVEVTEFARGEVIQLQVPKEMLKAPNGSMKRGLIPRTVGKTPPDPCYFDGRLDVEVTEFEDRTRLYKITDRTYAKDHPGITPSLVFRVIVPTQNLGTSRTGPIKREDGTTVCTVNVRFLDGIMLGSGSSGEYVDGRDAKSCEPWVRLPLSGIPSFERTANTNHWLKFDFDPTKAD